MRAREQWGRRTERDLVPYLPVSPTSVNGVSKCNLAQGEGLDREEVNDVLLLHFVMVATYRRLN